MSKGMVTFAILESSGHFQAITAFVDVFAMQKINVFKNVAPVGPYKGSLHKSLN
jgi:hypothetical protein